MNDTVDFQIPRAKHNLRRPSEVPNTSAQGTWSILKDSGHITHIAASSNSGAV